MSRLTRPGSPDRPRQHHRSGSPTPKRPPLPQQPGGNARLFSCDTVSFFSVKHECSADSFALRGLAGTSYIVRTSWDEIALNP